MDYSNQPLIPMSSPDLTEEERQAVLSVIETNYLSMGPKILDFEAEFCKFIGVKNAIAVNSGTSALHLCVRAAGIQAGDYVITSPFSFVASTNALLFENAIPVYVDVDPLTGNIDPQAARQAAEALLNGGEKASAWLPKKGAALGGKLKAILSVDVFGQPADFDPLDNIAKDYELKIIEDSCESLGAEYKGRKAGKLGNYATFAFYPNKQITTGEGGLIVTDDDQAANMMRALRNQGRTPGDTWLDHTLLGYNYRMDEMSAALGAIQMRRLPELLKKRQQVASWYQTYLSDISEIEAPFITKETTKTSWFVYVIRLKKGLDRQDISAKLRRLGIPVRPYFNPIHLQPYMVERFGFQVGDFPVTEDLGNRGLAIPFSGKMTEEQVRQVCEALKISLKG